MYLYRSDNKDYALKLIEGTGYSQSFSLSACREVAVSYLLMCGAFYVCYISLVVKRVTASKCDPLTPGLLVPW